MSGSALPPSSIRIGDKDYPLGYFLSLTVENIRCFRGPHTLDLSDGHGRPAMWTVILGENGVGKTTLLETLARELNISNECFLQSPAAHKHLGYANCRMVYSGGIEVLASNVKNMPNSMISIGQNSGQIVIDSERFEEAFISERHKARRVEENIFDYARDVKTSGDHFYLFWTLFKSERRVDDFSRLSSKSFEIGGNVPQDFSINIPNAEEWLLGLHYASSAFPQHESNPAKYFNLVKDIICKIIPDVESISIDITRDSSQPRVFFKTPYGEVLISNLSHGYQTTIAWTVDLARRLVEAFPDSPNPLAEPAICLVDEIDLHLHPKWQRDIQQRLRTLFPRTQFIVTAHSPLIVQASQDANVVVLRRDGDHVVIDNHPETVRGWRVDQILTSDLFGLESARPPGQAALLEERRAILGQASVDDHDRARLSALEAEIGELPAGENEQERKAFDLMRRVAERLNLN